MTARFQDKSVLVRGARGGIGQAIIDYFAVEVTCSNKVGCASHILITPFSRQDTAQSRVGPSHPPVRDFATISRVVVFIFVLIKNASEPHNANC